MSLMIVGKIIKDTIIDTFVWFFLLVWWTSEPWLYEKLRKIVQKLTHFFVIKKIKSKSLYLKSQ
jgi:hypothetical protein